MEKTQGLGFSYMPTVLRVRGFHFRINTLDHPPPHVHVLRGGASIKMFLDLEREPENHGMKWIEVARIRRLLAENRDFLLAEWNRIHPGP